MIKAEPSSYAFLFSFFSVVNLLIFYSPILPSDDDLPEISQCVPLMILYAVADISYRLISQIPYSKRKEKSKVLSGSPASAL